MQATFMLFSSAMGGGVLGLPKVLAFNGWAYGCVMILLGGVVSAYAQLICMRVLMKCNGEIEDSNKAIEEGEDSNVGDIHESPAQTSSKRSAREQIVDLERAGQKAKKQAPIGTYSDLLAYVMGKKGYSKKSVELVMHVVFFLYVYLGVCITYSGLFFKFMSPVIKSSLHDHMGWKSFSRLLIEAKPDHLKKVTTSQGYDSSKHILDQTETGAGHTQFTWAGAAIAFCLWFVVCVPKDASILRYIGYYPFGCIIVLCLYGVYNFFMFDPSTTMDGEYKMMDPKFADVAPMKWSEVFNILKDNSKNGGDPLFPALNMAPKGMGFWMGLFVGTKMVGNYTFAYMCHTNVVTVCRDMQNQDDATLKKVSFTNVAFATVGYMVVMCSVFFTFGTVLTRDGLNDEPFIAAYGTTETSVQIIRFLLGLMMICAIPLNFMPLRESAWAMYCAAFGLKKVSGSQAQLMDNVEMSVLSPNSGEGARSLRDAMSAQNTDASVAVIKAPLVEGSHNAANEDEDDDGLPEMSTTHRWIFTIVLLGSGIFCSKMLAIVGEGATMKVLGYVGLILAPIVMIVAPAYMMVTVFKSNFQTRFMFGYCALVVAGIVSAVAGDVAGLGENDAQPVKRITVTTPPSKDPSGKPASSAAANPNPNEPGTGGDAGAGTGGDAGATEITA